MDITTLAVAKSYTKEAIGGLWDKWSATVSYAKGQIVLREGIPYQANQQTTQGTWVASEWTQINISDALEKIDTKQDITNLVTAFQTTPDNTHYPSEKLVKDSIDEVDGHHLGVDLTVKFASEIAASPYNGDEAAWIQARLDAQDFTGIQETDYIPITFTNDRTLKAVIMGIDTYKGTPNTNPVPSHIDFITDELWDETVQYNLVNYNNGLGCDKFTGDGTTTVFQCCHRTASTFPSISKVMIGTTETSDYTYDSTTGVLTMTSAPASGAVIKAIWSTLIPNPLNASNVQAFLMSDKRGVANETTADPALTEVDYTNGGIWKYMPQKWKNVIKKKRGCPEGRYALGSLKTADTDYNQGDWEELWLPNEVEVKGFKNISHDYACRYPMQYEGFRRMNPVKKVRNGGNAAWWLSVAISGSSTTCLYLNGYGYLTNNSCSTSYRVPVCFRITKNS